MPINIEVRDESGTGHDYVFLYDENPDGPELKGLGELHFQNGLISEHGVNGVTNEAVLEALIDRMGKLQQTMPCRENALAITKMEEALMWFNRRTQKRVEQGVEGS